MSRIIRNVLYSIIVLAVVLGLQQGAKADSTSCTATDVLWESGLFINCGAPGSRRYDAFTSASCTVGSSTVTVTHTVDDLKFFQSLATAALISGHTLNIDFVNCNSPGDFLINGVSIHNP